MAGETTVVSVRIATSLRDKLEEQRIIECRKNLSDVVEEAIIYYLNSNKSN